MLPLRCLCLAIGVVAARAADASPPLPDDVSLSIRVVSTSDPTFQPGAHAVLAFKVGQHGPTDRSGLNFFVNNTTSIPSGAGQPFVLTPSSSSTCSVSSTDYEGEVFYAIGDSLPPLNQPIECLIDLDVLPPAEGGYGTMFTAVVMDPEDALDPVPGNSSAMLFVGNAEEPPPFFSPRIDPNFPTTVDSVRWIADWDSCGSLGPATVTNWGSRIDVRWPIQRGCGVPIVQSAVLDLGPLAAGHYTVHVEPCHAFGNFDEPCFPAESPPDVSFDVRGATPTSEVSVLSGRTLHVLVLALALVGAYRLQSTIRFG